jgi:hypothetical protein
LRCGSLDDSRKKRMARPACKGDLRWHAGLQQRIRSQGCSLAKMDPAHHGPHKDDGVEHHIFDQAAAMPVRPLRHLTDTSTDLFSDELSLALRVVDQTAGAAFGAKLRPWRRTAHAIRANLAANATVTTLG